MFVQSLWDYISLRERADARLCLWAIWFPDWFSPTFPRIPAPCLPFCLSAHSGLEFVCTVWRLFPVGMRENMNNWGGQVKMVFMLKHGGGRPEALMWETALDIDVFLVRLEETDEVTVCGCIIAPVCSYLCLLCSSLVPKGCRLIRLSKRGRVQTRLVV